MLSWPKPPGSSWRNATSTQSRLAASSVPPRKGQARTNPPSHARLCVRLWVLMSALNPVSGLGDVYVIQCRPRVRGGDRHYAACRWPPSGQHPGPDRGCLGSYEAVSNGPKALIDSPNGDPVNVEHMRRLADTLGIDPAHVATEARSAPRPHTQHAVRAAVSGSITRSSTSALSMSSAEASAPVHGGQ